MNTAESVTASPDQALETSTAQLVSSEPVSAPLQVLSLARLKQVGASLTDQALAVGGMFLANVMLARVQSKQEYGMFALSYSVYTFVAGLHNALILEPYSIHGGGRYHDRFSSYSRHMSRNNAFLGLSLTAVLSTVWLVLRRYDPKVASSSLLGLAFAAPILLTALFVRRTFYLRRRPDLAARFSVVSFVTLIVLLGVATKFGMLNGFSTFLIAALAWIVAGLALLRQLPTVTGAKTFTHNNPGHWNEHWKYARWVLVTAFVFQMTYQGYYWLVAGFISVKQVAELRAMYVLLAPADQIFVAVDLLVLPLMAFHYASRDPRNLISSWKRFGVLTFLFSVAYTALIWIFGRYLLHSLYAGRFDDVSPVLGIFATLAVIYSVGNTLNTMLKSIERPDLVFRAYIASGLVTAMGGVPLVRVFGLRGAVLGMLLSALIYCIAMGVGLSVASRHPRFRLGTRVVSKTISIA